jgi:hypothetical protein
MAVVVAQNSKPLTGLQNKYKILKSTGNILQFEHYVSNVVINYVVKQVKRKEKD